MVRRSALVLVVVAVGVGACGGGDDEDDDAPLSRTQVEQRVSEEFGGEASCVELATERRYRCELTQGSTTSYYEALVSKDGEVVQTVDAAQGPAG